MHRAVLRLHHSGYYLLHLHGVCPVLFRLRSSCLFTPKHLTERSRCRCRSTLTKSARAKIVAASDLISDALPFGRVWYLEVSDAIEYAKFYSRSHDAVIRVYDEVGHVIETHEHAGEFREW